MDTEKEMDQPEEATPRETPEQETEEVSELEAAKAEAEELKDKFLRSKADLENFRRRVEKEKADLQNFALESLLSDLLPVLDSFDKAVEERDEEESQSFFDGVSMVRKQLITVLEKKGLKPIEAKGENFDPNLHQAIQKVEREDVEEEKVDQEFAKGYLLNGRLLRPSMVTVAVPKS